MGSARQELLKAIPKVDEFLGWVADNTKAPITLVKSAVREILGEQRAAILAGALISLQDLDQDVLVSKFEELIALKTGLNFRSVINGTGVVVHTNLGRSILPKIAMESILRVGSGYSNLEFDLTTGRRGSRYSLVEGLLCDLTGAEAALVVNNNAAAVFLVLNTLANGREVVISRGQLVEIGGSFRIPDVMAGSGAVMVEIGTTNRTHLRDYEAAINDQTSLLLKVHTSNFKVIGFTSEVPLADMVDLGARMGIPVMEDLGSGCFVDLSRYGLQKEPTAGELMRTGVDVLTFSGDKLLGGPQAGVILGKKEIIDRVKKNPLNRALRIDKFTLAGLESVLRLYFDEKMALHVIPTLTMLTMPLNTIEKRARRLLRKIKLIPADTCGISVVKTESRVGGGALPEQGLASSAVALEPGSMTVNDLELELRSAEQPVIGRIEDDRFILDMRTVADNELDKLATVLLEILI
ncbi:MAG: L-seryl-tRNA(Sec) selenium transferase [Thermodesulfobacteriota bacterium]|nr:L-seryl-tRNA(Sec) selenium transferase [Thermodesulfobacteriota bacterium]